MSSRADDGGTFSAPPDWSSLLTAVAAGRQRLVLEAADGSRAVLLSERELDRLEAAGGKAPPPAAEGGPEDRWLTPRETEALGLVAEGLSGVEIAERLGLATNTVAQHLASVRRKLGVRSSAAAVDVARREGLLEPGPGS